MKMLFALLLTTTLQAQTIHMAVMGGGGEPHKKYNGQPNEETIFDDGLEALGLYANNPQVKTTIAFNGGHAKTEEISQRLYGVQKNFDPQEYIRIIESYKSKIKKGEIKSGDKILVHLMSHGAKKGPGDLTHVIAANGVVTDFNQMAGTTTVPVDLLKSLVDLATSKGIKLGIIDYSCHSGNTLALANANTCVISSTGPDHYAGAGTLAFGTLIAKSLGSGKSLEDAYLEARSGFNDVSFPMISTPQGKEVQNKLYSSLTPYLYYYNPNQDKFIPFMEQNVSAGAESCNLDEGLGTILREVQNVSRFQMDKATAESLKNFQKAVSEYHSFLNEVKRKMQQHGLGEIGKKHKLCSGKECITYTTKELAMGDYANTIRFFESQNPKEYKDQILILKQALALKEQILRDSPGAKDAVKFWNSYPDLQRRTSLLQSKVGASQRELYQLMYQHSEASGPNPCRDFKL